MVGKMDNATLYWVVFGIMCVCIVALAQSTRAAVCLSVFILAVAIGHAYYLRRHSMEHFGPGDTLYACADGTNTTCKPNAEPDAEDIDANGVSRLPLKKCDLYLTDNVGECDAGMYEMHYMELEERRRKLETSTDVSSKDELERINRVLADAALLPKRQCKLSMSNWVRPYHSSYPYIKSMENDYGPRGFPRQWAFCFAPMDRDNSLEYLKNGIAKNDRLLVAPTVVRSGMKLKLSNGVDNERVEFLSLKKEEMRKTYCNFFYPMRDERLVSYYQMFKEREQSVIYTVNMTGEGYIISMQLHKWRDGYLDLIPLTTTQRISTTQDDMSSLSRFNSNMPQTPDRFNIEMAYHCSSKPLLKYITTYRWLLRELYTEIVSDEKLFYQLKDTVTVYAFNVNICERVDRVKPMEGNLLELLGKTATRTTLIHPSAGKTQSDLEQEKESKHDKICAVASEMNDIYNRLQEIYEEQKKHGLDYRTYSQPDTGASTVMTPETQRVSPLFDALRKEQLSNEKKFKLLEFEKKVAVADIRKLNMMLTDIEANINTVIDTMMQEIKGKRIGIPEKPYMYISSDGKSYFRP